MTRAHGTTHCLTARVARAAQLRGTASAQLHLCRHRPARPCCVVTAAAGGSTRPPDLGSSSPAAVLGVPPGTAKAAAKRAYRELALQYHPDRNKSALADIQFTALQGAWDAYQNGRAFFDNPLAKAQGRVPTFPFPSVRTPPAGATSRGAQGAYAAAAADAAAAAASSSRAASEDRAAAARARAAAELAAAEADARARAQAQRTAAYQAQAERQRAAAAAEAQARLRGVAHSPVTCHCSFNCLVLFDPALTRHVFATHPGTCGSRSSSGSGGISSGGKAGGSSGQGRP
jgi:curved DNA-binding protein CbpA